MFFIFITLVIFIISPQINGLPLHHTNWPQNRTGRYDWGSPSPSLMGKFKKAAVTCDHGLCSEIGRDILIKGGNAVDSSIASLFCLGVTNPQSSGLGGGFIMTLYNATTQRCIAIDARESAPLKATQDMFHNDSAGSKYGWRAIATPGEIAGYWKAFSNYGSGKILWKDIVMPSVELARNGVPISEYLGNVLKVKEHQFLVTPSMKEWINPDTGAVYEYGDIIKRTKLADTLEEIANSNDPVELFYHGKFAEIFAKEFEEYGGIISKEDLANYQPKVYEIPLSSGRFNGDLVMCGPPPPASFAVAQAIIALGTKKYCDHSKAWNPIDAHRKMLINID
uniref:Gamma-glutamyltransferase n=1 Tax=Panagrolaimus superbus TaxID=310955 RepID=A0A914YXG3_9BILA